MLRLRDGVSYLVVQPERETEVRLNVVSCSTNDTLGLRMRLCRDTQDGTFKRSSSIQVSPFTWGIFRLGQRLLPRCCVTDSPSARDTGLRPTPIPTQYLIKCDCPWFTRRDAPRPETLWRSFQQTSISHLCQAISRLSLYQGAFR